MNTAAHEFPPPGVIAARSAEMLLPNSAATCSITARASGLFAKNPVSYV